MVSIDLNSDLGENTPDRHVADDLSMLRVVTSANVAGGFHAGSPVGIRQTLVEAKQLGITVGAHPGYNDYQNFGRTALDVEASVLQADIEYQLGALMGLASSVGVDLKYVKPHGALYNTIVQSETQAAIVTAAIKAVDPKLIFLGLSGGAAVEVAERAGLSVAREAFADRAYSPEGSLLSRRLPGAVLHDAEEVSTRMLQLVEYGTLTAVNGSEIQVEADSICVHGDSPGSIAIATAVRDRLTREGINLTSFVA